MPSIVIRLHPDKAVDPPTFTTYLQDLQIQATDLSFASPRDGTPVGAAATFLAATINPPDPPDPPDYGGSAGANTGIVQHTAESILPAIYSLVSLATAVIEVPATGFENLQLTVTRGAGQIDAGGPYYNVVVDPGTYTPDQFQGLTDISMYLALPAPVTAANAVYLTLPSDGSPPNADQLLTAVQGILGVDPGGAAPDLATLTPDQCKNIAYEIVWSTQPPLPSAPDVLSDLYDNPPNTGAPGDQNEQNRKQFEGALASYYATPNAAADRLAKWVYALAAAFACQESSQAATAALLSFPVDPGQVTSAPLSETQVILTAAISGNPLPGFAVPAPYFYALGVSMPVQVPPAQRYQMACGDTMTRVLAELTAAVESGLIGDSYQVGGAGPTVNPAQAVRYLSALVGLSTAKIPQCPLDATLQPLVTDWLAYPPPPPAIWKKYQPGDDDIVLWPSQAAAHPAALLELVLCALTDAYVIPVTATPAVPPGTTLASVIQAFLATIQSPPSVAELAGLTAGQWSTFFLPTSGYLPPFTKPGNQVAQIAAWVRHVQKFFEIAQPALPTSYTAAGPGAPPLLTPPSTDWLQDCLTAYQGIAGAVLALGSGFDLTDLQLAVAAVFPGDPAAQAWAAQAITTLDQLWALAVAVEPNAPIAFSIAEALYARGLADLAAVQQLQPADLQQVLTGTIAYDYASAISEAAQGSPASGSGNQGPFSPVNPDGSLTDCVPPPWRSPLGPVAYLGEMLGLSQAATCESPLAPAQSDGADLGAAIAARRGPLTGLRATRANVETPIPVIDMVNECLENLAANLPATAGAVYDTGPAELAGHRLCAEAARCCEAECGCGAECRCEAGCRCEPAGESRRCHDPATLFGVLPEHSSPAAPAAQPGGYATLRTDFSAPCLPYSQPLDVARSYLKALGETRLAAMRAFREHITEFALDPDLPPPGFQTHLWRYPLRLDLTLELLGLTPEEFGSLFENPGTLSPWQLYGFAGQAVDDEDWTQAVANAAEICSRTGLTYCELVDLQRCGLVAFRWRDSKDGMLPDCEPCCLADLVVDFGEDASGALVQLATFVRLWRALRRGRSCGYSFDELADVYVVLGPAAGGLTSEFIRQLGALEVLRRDFCLPLTGRGETPPGATGADRTALLALWAGPASAAWEWAVTQLRDRVQDYACRRHHGVRRGPEFVKLLQRNLDALSVLAGFDPGNAPDTWHARPACTLRLAEVLAKICASDFGIGEILYLCAAGDHLDGDDPFPLTTPNEALDLPLALPGPGADDGAQRHDEHEGDEGREHGGGEHGGGEHGGRENGGGEHDESLWELREALLAVEVSEEDAHRWTWGGIVGALREEFGYAPLPGGPDPLAALGRQLFPAVLVAEGITISPAQRAYRVSLAGSSEPLWNAPAGGPFRYEAAPASELSLRLPVTDADVIAKLSGMQQLSADEAAAVQNLYFLPRVDLAALAFLFPDLLAADRRLIQERDEERRWSYFRRHFALTHARCRLIAEHLARHVARQTGCVHPDGERAAWQLLRQLHADENRGLSPWESDTGDTPQVTWPGPGGGAFAALLGLTGTGLLGEFANHGHDQPVLWREAGGVRDWSGCERDERNSPVPTVLPALDLTLPPGELRQVSVQNGYAIRDHDGRPLGGAQGFAARWRGVLLVEQEGRYRFEAGAPACDDDCQDCDEGRRWRVTIGRGQRTWTVLNHRWPDDDEDERGGLRLERGSHEICIDFLERPPEADWPRDVEPHHSGFQLRYAGPDSDDRLVAIPFRRLFRATADQPLASGISFPQESQAQAFLQAWFTSSLRDIRRTYQRAFKALLFVSRFGLSARRVGHDHGQSELGYLLADPDGFAGVSYYRGASGFTRHAAGFDPNLLPLLDDYLPPDPAVDDRVQPSAQRSAALFDWWERIFDYARMRADAREDSDRRAIWLLFREAQQGQPADPSRLLRHLGIDLRHAGLLLSYFDAIGGDIRPVTSADLTDDRWAVRIWHGEEWIRAMLRQFRPADITAALPFLWVADDPSATLAGESSSGNANLSGFLADGLFENGPPCRYAELQEINDGLRVRARDALAAFLCALDRVALPWGGSARCMGDLSALLLIDVAAGTCERASRIEDAISAAQAFIRRARLGLEQAWAVGHRFARLWDARFATFATWQACRRREIYQENWVEWEELERSTAGEAFQLLQSQLRRAALTVAIPGGLEWWPDERPPEHPALRAVQSREPAQLRRLVPPREGLDLLGAPERGARPSWLAPLGVPGDQTSPGQPGDPAQPPGNQGQPPGDPAQPRTGDQGSPGRPEDGGVRLAAVAVQPAATSTGGEPGTGTGGGPGTVADSPTLPYWMQAAIDLGTRFYRIAAAGEPLAGQPFAPHDGQPGSACCCACGGEHPPLVDEYYFWITDSGQFTESVPSPSGQGDPQPYQNGYQVSYYDQSTQESALWQDESQLPQLLSWEPGPAVVLRWCRVHNNEFQQPRCSTDSVAVLPGVIADLTFTGRSADSLTFAVTSAQLAPLGYDDPSAPGFRYDLASDLAVVLPEVTAPPPPPTYLGVLPAYPFFVYDSPGAALFPASWYGPALAVACALRARCQFEAALKWYQRAFDPLSSDNTWMICGGDDDKQPRGGTSTPPGETSTPPGEAGPPVAADVAATEVGRGDRSSTGPCCDATDITAATARDRSVLLLFLETLLHWNDALMRRCEPEAMPAAAPEAFAQARLLVDTAATILGPRPRTVLSAEVVAAGTVVAEDGPVSGDETDGDQTVTVVRARAAQTVGEFTPDWPALNPRLLDLYGLVADRQAMIHACLNGRRRRDGSAGCERPAFRETPPDSGWRTGPGCAAEPDSCGDETGWCRPHSPYRFLFLVQKAEELAMQVRELGSGLLAAYEKGDAEYLAALRAGHERELLVRGLAVRQDQWRDADWQIQALQLSKSVQQANLLYYNTLIQGGLVNNEVQYRDLSNTAMVTRAAGNIVQAIGEVMKIIPDLFVGFPCEEVQPPVGSKLGGVFESAGRIIDVIADVESATAALDLTEAGWDRRLAEWIHQAQILTIDVEHTERQILGAERRRDQALHELNSQRRQIEQSGEVQDFLKRKFTAHDLYLYLQRETAALHRQMYELAVHLAREAEHAFNIERGHTARRFLPREPWDSLHEGLLAGERLYNALQHMEKAYLDENVREYELTKHLSLRLHFPAAYLQLRDRGECEICIPEWMFDLDYPGMYLRRIKNVTLSVPCVTGPYTGVHCRLTLLSSETRIDPRLAPPPHHCCAERSCGAERGEYELCPDDPRVVRQYGALEAIATSSGQTDSGLFEMSFHDDRYLPFEYAGAVSRWRLELPQETNQFDLDTLSDVVVHLNFTAREGGELLRAAASEVAQWHLPGGGVRFFDVRHEFPDAWSALRGAPHAPDLDGPVERDHDHEHDDHEHHEHGEHHGPHGGRRLIEFPLRMSRDMFPFLPGRSDVRIRRIDLFFEAPGAEPSESRHVHFFPGHRPGCPGGGRYGDGHHGDGHHRDGDRHGRRDDGDCDCPRVRVDCVASREWPRLFHGVLETELPPLPGDDYRDLGTFRFGRDVSGISRAFLLCAYVATSRKEVRRWRP